MIVGIDPGIKGAIAWLTEDGQIDSLEDMPTLKDGKKTLVDAVKLYNLLKFDVVSIRLVVLEKVGARPGYKSKGHRGGDQDEGGQGAVSGFSFGRTLGRTETPIAILGLPMEFPTPQRWKKVVLEGTEKDKQAAIAYVQRRWPDAELTPPRCRVPRDGRADAILLAEFGRRLLGGKP